MRGSTVVLLNWLWVSCHSRHWRGVCPQKALRWLAGSRWFQRDPSALPPAPLSSHPTPVRIHKQTDKQISHHTPHLYAYTNKQLLPVLHRWTNSLVLGSMVWWGKDSMNMYIADFSQVDSSIPTSPESLPVVSTYVHWFCSRKCRRWCAGLWLLRSRRCLHLDTAARGCTPKWPGSTPAKTPYHNSLNTTHTQHITQTTWYIQKHHTTPVSNTSSISSTTHTTHYTNKI